MGRPVKVTVMVPLLAGLDVSGLLSRYPVIRIRSAPTKLLFSSPRPVVAQVLLESHVTDVAVGVAAPATSALMLAKVPVALAALTQLADGINPATSVRASVLAGSLVPKFTLIDGPATKADADCDNTAAVKPAAAHRALTRLRDMIFLSQIQTHDRNVRGRPGPTARDVSSLTPANGNSTEFRNS